MFNGFYLVSEAVVYENCRDNILALIGTDIMMTYPTIDDVRAAVLRKHSRTLSTSHLKSLQSKWLAKMNQKRGLYLANEYNKDETFPEQKITDVAINYGWDEKAILPTARKAFKNGLGGE